MRTSPVHYIAPSAISIVPNCNGSANDLAVTISRNAKIKVYSPRAGIDKTTSGEYQEWTLTGRNRRLADSTKPYTIYARLSALDNTAYLIFAPMTPQESGEYMSAWTQAYSWVTTDGLYVFGKGSDWEEQRTKTNCIFVRLGDVSLPDANNQRTVTLDTGILGTEQFNDEWALRPDELPLRIELGCTIDNKDVGLSPYVYWDESLVLVATLTEGWTGTDIQRFHHWEIKRNTGVTVDDTGVSGDDDSWPSQERREAFATSGRITLSHTKGSNDDFNCAVSTMFTIAAMEEVGNGVYAALKTATISVLAETVEKYEMSLSTAFVSYDPKNGQYSPTGGVAVRFRATNQRGEVFMLTKEQFTTAGLAFSYSPVGSSSWQTVVPAGAATSEATVTVPVTAFSSQKSVNIRLCNASGKELTTDTIAFIRDGEDSKEREWIFLQSTEEITFGTQAHPYPANINSGTIPDPKNPGQRIISNDKTKDDWVPDGWSDEMQGTDSTNKYEYGAYRDYDHANSTWSAFTEPKIWGHWGKDGDNAPYDVLSYARSKSRTSHAAADIDTSYGSSGWGSVAPSPTDTYPYVWQRAERHNKDGVVVSTSYVCLTGATGTAGTDAAYISLKGACHAPEGSEPANPNDCELTICNGKDTVTYTQADFGQSKETEIKRGVVLVYINRQTLEIANSETPYFFDTYGDVSERDWLAMILQAAPTDYFVCLISYDAVGFSPALENALKACGGTSLKNNTAVGRYPFAFIGYRGLREGYAAQIEGELESATTADTMVYVAGGNMTVSRNGEDGRKGDNGDDAINVIVTPASVIVNQSLVNPDNLNSLSEQILFSVMQGTVAKSVSKVEITSIEQDSTVSPARNKCSVSGSNSYYATLTAIGKNADGAYYEQAYFICKVWYDDNSKSVENIKVMIYANLLGTWKETVEADVKREVATAKYYFKDEDGNVVAHETIGDFIKSSTENISTLTRGIQGSNINILYGVDGYTASNKLVHKSSAIDGFKEYDGNGAQHIFTSVQLIAGCTYTIQCVTDGTIASSHDGATSHNPSDKLCTIWLRMNLLLNGGYAGEVFTSSRDGYQNLGDGRHKWTFVCLKTGEYWFRTNSYSDGTTEVTINFWNIKLEGGGTCTEWSASASQMTSEIKQMVDEISLYIQNGLQRTGVDIINGLIKLIANKTLFMTSDGVPMIAVQMADANGNVGTGPAYTIPSIVFYDGDINNGGQVRWVLNYRGLIEALSNTHDYKMTPVEGYLSFFSLGDNDNPNRAGMNINAAFTPAMLAREDYPRMRIVDYYHDVFYLFTSGYQIINGNKIYIPLNGPDYEYIYWQTQGLTADKRPDYNLEEHITGTNAPANGYYVKIVNWQRYGNEDEGSGELFAIAEYQVDYEIFEFVDGSVNETGKGFHLSYNGRKNKSGSFFSYEAYNASISVDGPIYYDENDELTLKTILGIE